MKKRTGWLSLIALFTIVGGVLYIVGSLPVFSLYNSIKQGGITVNNKVSVRYVQPGSPAEGYLQIGDVIVSINNKRVTTSEEVIAMTTIDQGKTIEIDIERNGKIDKYFLIPRVIPTPGQGRLGILLANTAIQNEPLYQVIPQVILRSYSGYEEVPDLTFTTSRVYQDKSFSRLLSLIFGIISVFIGFGLWKLKRWGWFGFFALTLLSLVANLFTNARFTSIQINPILSKRNTDMNLFTNLLSIILEIIVVIYIYKLRDLFTKK